MEFVKIAEICQISNGYAFKSGKYVDNNGARIIRITNVQKGEIVDNDPKFYPFNLLDSLDNYKILEGDILMSLTGNVGRVGKFPKELLPAYINQRICRVMPKDNRLDVNYLFHYLNSNIFEKEAIRNSAGAAQLNLSTKWLENHLIPLPSLEEQKAIAARLDKADEIRQLNQQIINHYDELIQALFIDMFGDPVKNEKGWEKSIIGEVCSKIQIGPFGSQLHQSDYVDNGLPLINPVNIKKDKIDLLNSVKITQEKYDELPNYHLRIHDIILARRGDLSKIGYIRNENNFCGTGSLFIRLKSNLNSFFIFKLLNHTSTINYLYENAQGVTMPNLNKKIVYNIPIFLPPIELQNQFAERVEKIEAQKELAVQALQQSEDLFNSLLQQAFKK